MSRNWGAPWTILSVVAAMMLAGTYAAPAFAQGVDGSTTMITIDAPAQGQTLRYGDEVSIGGWAADVAAPGGVTTVEVYLDGKKDEGGTLIGQATYGKPRSDVANQLKSTAFTNVGFDLTWKVNTSIGDHTVYVYVQSPNGWNYLTTSFHVASGPAAQPSTSGSMSTTPQSSSRSFYGAQQSQNGQGGSQMWGQYVAGLTPANAAQSAAQATQAGGTAPTNAQLAQAFATAQGALGQTSNLGSMLGTQYGTQYGTSSAYATGYPYANSAYSTGYPYANSAYSTGYPYANNAYATGYPYGSNIYNTGYQYNSSIYNTGYPYGGNAYGVGYPYGTSSVYGYGGTPYGGAYGSGYNYVNPYYMSLTGQPGYGAPYGGYGSPYGGYTGYPGYAGYSGYPGYGYPVY